MEQTEEETEYAFLINDKKLKMQYELAYFDIPILFTCTYKDEIYLCCCVDSTDLDYLVMKTTYKRLLDMLEGKILLTESFNDCEEKYFVETVNNGFAADKVTKIDKLTDDLSPKDNAYYTIYSEGDRKLIEYCKEKLGYDK